MRLGRQAASRRANLYSQGMWLSIGVLRETKPSAAVGGRRRARMAAPMSLSLLASVLAAAFAAVVGERWLRTRRPAFAAWSAGLAIFSVAAAAQAAGEHSGFGSARFLLFS